MSYQVDEAARELRSVLGSLAKILDGAKVITITDNGDGRKTYAVVDRTR